MLVYLDACIAIYTVEGPPSFLQRAKTHVALLESRGCSFVVSHLTRLECLIKPLRLRDGQLLLDYEAFFNSPKIRTVGLSSAAFQRAAAIRARGIATGGRKISVADSLHVAAAIESGCSAITTNDARLANVAGIAIDILP